MRITDKNGIKMRVPINFDDFDELNIDRKTMCIALLSIINSKCEH